MSSTKIATEDARDGAAASERRTRDFVELASDWFWETGPDFRFTYASDRLKEATGVSPYELIGRSVDEFFAEASGHGAMKCPGELMRERQPFRDVVVLYCTSGGRTGHMRVSGVPILADDGSFQGYRGCATDITAEVKATALAQHSDALLRNAIESLTEGLAFFDANERLVICNSRYRDTFELIRESIVPGVGIKELLQLAAERRQFQFESAPAWVNERLRRFRNSTGPFEERLNDGRHVQFADYSTAEGGRISICIDITDRTRTESALKESENKFKGLLKVSPDAMIVVNENGDIILASDVVLDLFGYSQEELVGKPLGILIPDRYRTAHQSLSAGYIANPRISNMRSGIPLYGRRKDGTEFPAEVSLRPSHTSDGLVVLAAIRDVTERKRTEQALRESREGLERAQKIGRLGSVKVDLVTGEKVWSTQQYRLFGFDPAAGGGDLDLALSRVHPDDRALLRDERAGNAHGEEPKRFDYRIVLPSGETRWVRREAEIERDAAGRPVMLYATHQDITEIIRGMQELAATQKLLKENEARYRSYFESAVDAQFLGTADGSIIEVNPAACEMLGMSAEEIKRDGLVELSDPRLLAAMKERDVSGKVRTEFTMIRADGSRLPVEASVSQFTDAAGRQMIAVSMHDLSKRKQAEEALREIRDGLERAQKIGRIGSAAINLATGKVAWSAQEYRLFGFDPAAGGGGLELILSCIHPDDRRLLIDERTRNMNGEEPRRFDYRIILPSGETRWVRREAEIERDAAGRPVALHAIDQDITEIIRRAQELAAAQNLLKESEARYRSYFESAMDAQFLGTADGSIIEVNPAACEMLGRTAEEIKQLGRYGLLQLTDPHHHAAMKEHDVSGKARAEFTMIRADGSRFPVEASMSQFTDAGGRQMITVSIRDVTARKLIEAQLAQAQKMEALGTLAGGVAHDLNNTLVPILVFTQLAAASLPEASPDRQYLETVIEAGNRAKDLVEQILTFSRSDTTERTPMDLTRAVGEALKMLRAGISPTIDLRAEVPSEPLPVLGNATQIHQVVMNLCTNAAHAIGGKTGKITVVLRAERGNGGHPSEKVPAGCAKLSVVDDGIGMNEVTRRRIFDPFFTTKPVGEGTGLGLAIVHSIVAAHDGTITVESQVGAGTRFEVSFPLIIENIQLGG